MGNRRSSDCPYLGFLLYASLERNSPLMDANINTVTSREQQLESLPTGMTYRKWGVPTIRIVDTTSGPRLSRNPLVRFFQWWVS